MPLRKLQRGIGIPVLPGTHLLFPKGRVLLCKCDGKAPAMATPQINILPEPRTCMHAEGAGSFLETCSSQNNNGLEQIKITPNHLNHV